MESVLNTLKEHFLAQMTKYVDFNWKVPVPQVTSISIVVWWWKLNKLTSFCIPKELLEGTLADKWIEEKDSADLEYEAFFRFFFLCFWDPIKNYLARVDEYGFFIYWKSEGREGDVKELSQVNDIRQGELPKVSIYNICEK